MLCIAAGQRGKYDAELSQTSRLLLTSNRGQIRQNAVMPYLVVLDLLKAMLFFQRLFFQIAFVKYPVASLVVWILN